MVAETEPRLRNPGFGNQLNMHENKLKNDQPTMKISQCSLPKKTINQKRCCFYILLYNTSKAKAFTIFLGSCSSFNSFYYCYYYSILLYTWLTTTFTFTSLSLLSFIFSFFFFWFLGFIWKEKIRWQRLKRGSSRRLRKFRFSIAVGFWDLTMENNSLNDRWSVVGKIWPLEERELVYGTPWIFGGTLLFY